MPGAGRPVTLTEPPGDRAMQYTRSEAKAWAQANLNGFHDAPLTPSTRDGDVDLPALRHNVDAFAGMGMDGIVVGGFIGEAWNLTLSEWMRYPEAVADANAGRMKMSTIILDPSARQALEKIEFTRTLGFEVAEVMNPAVWLKSDDETFFTCGRISSCRSRWSSSSSTTCARVTSSCSGRPSTTRCSASCGR